jgi:hypothetical protein
MRRRRDELSGEEARGRGPTHPEKVATDERQAIGHGVLRAVGADRGAVGGIVDNLDPDP